MALEKSSLVVEPLERGELFLTPELCTLDRRLQHVNRLIVDPKWHRKRMPVLTAMRKREPRRIGEAARRSVHDLGDHRQRAHRPRAHAWNEQQFGEIGRGPDPPLPPGWRKGAASAHRLGGRHDGRA